MCEANAYVYEDGKEVLFLEGVDILIPEGERLFLRNLFGEQKTFEGRIREISLVKHKIVLERIPR
ncbi:MAG: CooT family nickel-binding protein [Thermodesulfovibrionales bacterium]|nr:CooT family nickel-binding protein [Thermodesulfovibrionales bacterium]